MNKLALMKFLWYPDMFAGFYQKNYG